MFGEPQPYRRGEVIHELVREWASRCPESVALVHADQRVSYAELDAASADFAARLQKFGVRPGMVVPTVLPRSAQLVVALLAVLRCGAAYAALDPRWPDRRTASLVDRIGPVVVVGGQIDGVQSCPPPDLSAAGRTPTPVSVRGDQSCAVFFTSGTTGEPKGVLSPHRGTVRLFQDCGFAQFDQDTVMPLAAAVPWDAFSLELWAVLINGGRSVIVDEHYLAPAKLRELITNDRVNSVSLTSSLFNMIVDEDLGAFATVGQVFVGAERVSPVHIRRFLRAHPAARLVHCYGPAESTIFTTTHQVSLADCERPGGIPLGIPVPNTGVHLDGGEVLVSGDGLASGYLDDPALTDEKFVEQCVDGTPRRVYRTGDLVTVGADGQLSFAGRVDRQVKIRGHRIEPAEIERVASRLPGVGRCAAVAVPDGRGGYRGVTLFHRRGEVTADELKAHLARELPAYLVPQSLHEVDEFPLNNNGKLDSDALLATVEPVLHTVHARPDEAPYVRLVADVVAAVLGLPDAPREVAFFDLGGDSLGIGRVSTRLSTALGWSVPLSVVARHTTVDDLAAWVAGAAEAVMPTQADGWTGVADPVPLSPIQTFFLARQQAMPDTRSYNCVMCWWVDGPLDVDVLTEALADVHRRHDGLRAAYLFQEHDGPPIATLAGTPERPEVLRLAGPVDESTVVEALTRPMNLARGGAWRAVVGATTGAGRNLLGIAVHHIAFDGASEAVLTAELRDCYAARLGGHLPRFINVAPTLAQLELDRRAQVARTDLDAQREYWRQTLHQLPEITFPAPEPPVPVTSSPSVLTCQLAPNELAAVDSLARHHATTRFTVLFATYAWALASTTGQSDFGIGVPISRRGNEMLANAIGCFIDMLCLRVDVRPQDGPAGAIRDLGATVLGALAAQDVSFRELVELGRPGTIGRTPLHQTMFALQDNTDAVLDLPSLTTHPVRSTRQQAPFELIAEVWPGPDGSALVEFTYQTDKVAAEFVERVAEAFLDGLGLRIPMKEVSHVQ